MMRKIIILLLIATIAISFSSCFTTKTSVGQYREMGGETYKYAKGKQVWLFWGLIPCGYTRVSTPADGNCEVIGRFNFGDFLINLFTGGIVNTRTIKIQAKRPPVNNVSMTPEEQQQSTIKIEYEGHTTENPME